MNEYAYQNDDKREEKPVFDVQSLDIHALVNMGAKIANSGSLTAE
jgi:hypothetical protein